MKNVYGRINTAQFIETPTEIRERAIAINTKKCPIAMDYYPVHRAKAVNEWIDSQATIRPIGWPGNSGDLMPVEAIWEPLLHDKTGKTTLVKSRQ